MSSRRRVLQLIGGGTVLAAASAGGFLHISAPSKSARVPWRTAGQYDELRRRCLSYALLAPNPHNRQPWLVELEGDTSLSFYCDLDRRLPVTDPYDRQITIGCGAFLELLRLAAAEEGYRLDIVLFPDGEDISTLDRRPIARVNFVEDEMVTSDPLFAQVLARRSNKEVYKPIDVPANALESLAETGRVFGVNSTAIGNTGLAGKLRDLTWKAHVKESTTPDAMQESIDLMRIGAREVSANPDGIELEGPLFTGGKWAGLITPETMGDPNSTAFKQGLDMYQAMAMSARAYGWIITPDGSRVEQINAGRAHVRLNLKATELGLGIHPWSQALQEYDEMNHLYRDVHDLIGTEQRIQMLFRIGYSTPVIATPRRGLEAHLVG